MNNRQNILIIRGIENIDIFEETAGELYNNFNEKKINYDKIPDFFYQIKDIPLNTNLCCAYDGDIINGPPVFIPLNINQTESMKPLGYFCDYPCAVAFASNNVAVDSEKKDELLKNIFFLYKKRTGEKVEYILPAECTLNIDKYGGDYTISEWRNNQRKYIISSLPI